MLNIAISLAIYSVNNIIIIIYINKSVTINFIINIANIIAIKINLSININYYFILFLFFLKIINYALNIIAVKLGIFNYILIIKLFFNPFNVSFELE